MRFSKEILVGALFLLALFVLVSTTMIARGNRFEAEENLSVLFGSVGGLELGASVFYSGVEIGSVGDIQLTDEGVLVDLSLRERVPLYNDATILIRVPVALAKTTIHINPGSPDSGPKDKTARLHGVSPIDLLTELAPLAADIKAGKGNIGKLFKDESLYNNINQVAAKINNGEGVLGVLLNDKKLAGELRAAVSSIRESAAKISTGDGPMAMLLNDKNATKQLRSAIASLASITDKIDSGTGALGVLVNDKKTGAQLAASVANISRISAAIDQVKGEFQQIIVNVNDVTGGLARGEGTLGKLLKDDTVINQISSLLKRLNDSIEAAREQAPITSFTSVLFGSLR